MEDEAGPASTPASAAGEHRDSLLASANYIRDPNVRFPQRPRLIDDVRIYRMPDGLGVRFHFNDVPVIFRGYAADRLVDLLLPMLDGTRTITEIAEACPPELEMASVVKTIVLLHKKGLLAGGSPDTVAADETMRRQLLFWGRHLDLTRANVSASDVQQRITKCQITVIGTGLFGAAVCDLLARTGYRTIRVLAEAKDDILWEPLSEAPQSTYEPIRLPAFAPEEIGPSLREHVGADIVVTATRNASAELFRKVNRVCLQSSQDWLRGNFDATQIEIGPYVQPFRSACFGCLEIRERNMRELPIEEHLNQQDLAAESNVHECPPIGEAVYSATLAASLLVGEVVRATTEISVPTLVNSVLRASAVTGIVQRNQLMRVPRCPECYRGVVSRDDT